VAEQLGVRPESLDTMRDACRRRQLGDDAEDEKKKQADRLVALALKNAELFHAPDGGGWADVKIDGRRETWFLKSRTFERWLQHQYYEDQKTSANSDAMSTAVKTLGSIAYYKSPERQVFTRIGSLEGKIYLDLADQEWRAVEVDSEGWRIIDKPPVRFRRVGTMRSLMVPESGGSVGDLKRFINIGSEEDFVLVVAWLLAGLRPEGPYPVLTLHGPPGASKSTLTRMLRALIDPAMPANRQLPKEKDDLFIAATNNLVLPFENVSTVTEWLSDAFCVLSTGGGLGKRTLYTDSDETTFDVQRPIILNGIENFVVRGDLADRSIPLVLDSIGEKRRKAEKRLWSEFNQAKAKILGALLDLVTSGLRKLPNTSLDEYPRMADFALWVTSCESGGGWSEVKFLEAYKANRVDASRVVVEDDVVAQIIQKHMAARESWEGTASELLKELNAVVGEHKPKGWPARSNKLSGKLRGLMAHLPKVGIEVEFCRSGREGTRTIGLKKLQNLSSASSASSVDSGNNGLDHHPLSSADRQPIVSALSSATEHTISLLTVAQTIADDNGAPVKSLKEHATDDTDATDDKFRSVGGRGCRKCGSSEGEVNAYTIDGVAVNLHRTCVPFWRKDPSTHASLLELPTFLDRRPDRGAS